MRIVKMMVVLLLDGHVKMVLRASGHDRENCFDIGTDRYDVTS